MHRGGRASGVEKLERKALDKHDTYRGGRMTLTLLFLPDA